MRSVYYYGCQVVKRVTRSMTGILSRKRYVDVQEHKHTSHASSAGTGHPSVFKLGQYIVPFSTDQDF